MGSKVSFRIAGLAVTVLALAALVPSSGSSPPQPGDPLAGLSAVELERFNAGKAEFQGVETVAEGLGPVFNDVSCGSCHSSPAVGGGSDRLETRFGALTADGRFDPLSQFGGSLIQEQGIGASATCEYLAEIVPPEATIIAKRRTTPLFGLGLVDAVPDSEFLAIAQEQRRDAPGIAGVVSVVTNLSTGKPAVGRRGRVRPSPAAFAASRDIPRGAQ